MYDDMMRAELEAGYDAAYGYHDELWAAERADLVADLRADAERAEAEARRPVLALYAAVVLARRAAWEAEAAAAVPPF